MLQHDINERPYFETLDGVEYEKVSPNVLHGLAQGAILRILNLCGGAFGVAIAELHTRIGSIDGSDTTLVPDVAFFRREALRALDGDARLIPGIAPEVAVEIRSPNDRLGLRQAKIAKYLAVGTIVVLDIDPLRRLVTAHTSDGKRRSGAHDRFEHPAVPWLTFDVIDVFADIDRIWED